MKSDDCSEGVSCDAMTSVFALLGKRWTGVIISTLINGGPSRFSGIARQIPGVSERMLSARLTELVEAGLAEREVLEGPPVGVEYRLTPRGAALRPALEELGRWAEEHLDTSDCPDEPQAEADSAEMRNMGTSGS